MREFGAAETAAETIVGNSQVPGKVLPREEFRHSEEVANIIDILA